MDPLVWRGEGAPMTEGLAVPEVDVDDLHKMLAEGATLLDVREPDEVEEVRVLLVDPHQQELLVQIQFLQDHQP